METVTPETPSPEVESVPRDLKAESLEKLAHYGRITARFLKTCYVDGGKALLAGRYSKRQAALVIVSTLPAILGLLFLTVPGILFPTPSHNEFFHFAANITGNPASILPTLFGAASATLGLRIPVS